MECPNCKSSEFVREVIYGMPVAEPDPRKYLVGGCCMELESADFRCIKCSWEHQADITKILVRHVSENLKLLKK